MASKLNYIPIKFKSLRINTHILSNYDTYYPMIIHNPNKLSYLYESIMYYKLPIKVKNKLVNFNMVKYENEYKITILDDHREYNYLTLIKKRGIKKRYNYYSFNNVYLGEIKKALMKDVYTYTLMDQKYNIVYSKGKVIINKIEYKIHNYGKYYKYIVNEFNRNILIVNKTMKYNLIFQFKYPFTPLNAIILSCIVL
jgi:hypothetical protein